MTTAAIIQARLGSSRLPNKVLADIHGHPMLWHVVTRARRIPGVDTVVVATSFSEADQHLISWCQREAIPVYRGGMHEDDVLGRYFDVATQLGADAIVRLTGDCPCIDVAISSAVVLSLSSDQKPDYCTNAPGKWPDGLDTEAFTYEALVRAHKAAKSASDREHVTTYIRNHPKQFVIGHHAPPQGDWSHIKWSVDTAEELELIRALFADLGDDFGLAEALAWWGKRGKEDNPNV